jgi:cob(I)alamin adenosyltransferase
MCWIGLPHNCSWHLRVNLFTGNRISRVVTRTGDTCSTGLADGSRLAKTDARIVALGEVDELNCHLGVLLTLALPLDVPKCIKHKGKFNRLHKVSSLCLAVELLKVGER